MFLVNGLLAVGILAGMVGCQHKHEGDDHHEKGEAEFLGSFEKHGADISAYELGRCHTYVLKRKTMPEPHIFYSCPESVKGGHGH